MAGKRSDVYELRAERITVLSNVHERLVELAAKDKSLRDTLGGFGLTYNGTYLDSLKTYYDHVQLNTRTRRIIEKNNHAIQRMNVELEDISKNSKSMALVSKLLSSANGGGSEDTRKHTRELREQLQRIAQQLGLQPVSQSGSLYQHPSQEHIDVIRRLSGTPADAEGYTHAELFQALVAAGRATEEARIATQQQQTVIEEAQTAASNAQSRVSELESELDNLKTASRKELKEEGIKIRDVRGLNKQLVKQKSALKEKIVALETRVNLLDGQVDGKSAVEQLVSAMSDIGTLKEKLSRAEADLIDAEQRCADFENKSSEAILSLNEMSSTSTTAQEQLEEVKGHYNTLYWQHSNLLDDIAAVEQENRDKDDSIGKLKEDITQAQIRYQSIKKLIIDTTEEVYLLSPRIRYQDIVDAGLLSALYISPDQFGATVWQGRPMPFTSNLLRWAEVSPRSAGGNPPMYSWLFFAARVVPPNSTRCLQVLAMVDHFYMSRPQPALQHLYFIRAFLDRVIVQSNSELELAIAINLYADLYRKAPHYIGATLLAASRVIGVGNSPAGEDKAPRARLHSLLAVTSFLRLLAAVRMSDISQIENFFEDPLDRLWKTAEGRPLLIGYIMEDLVGFIDDSTICNALPDIMLDLFEGSNTNISSDSWQKGGPADFNLFSVPRADGSSGRLIFYEDVEKPINLSASTLSTPVIFEQTINSCSGIYTVLGFILGRTTNGLFRTYMSPQNGSKAWYGPLEALPARTQATLKASYAETINAAWADWSAQRLAIAEANVAVLKLDG